MKSLEFFSLPFSSFTRLISRFKHSLSLPEEIASDLGIFLSNRLDYVELRELFLQREITPTKLHRFMERSLAEGNFRHAKKFEKFCRESHFSYCFNGNWVDFTLHFDQQDRLRRLYIHCCGMAIDEQHEISLQILP